MSTLSGTRTILAAMFKPAIPYASVQLLRESKLAHADVAEETAYLTRFTVAGQDRLTGAH